MGHKTTLISWYVDNRSYSSSLSCRRVLKDKIECTTNMQTKLLCRSIFVRRQEHADQPLTTRIRFYWSKSSNREETIGALQFVDVDRHIAAVYLWTVSSTVFRAVCAVVIMMSCCFRFCKEWRSKWSNCSRRNVITRGEKTAEWPRWLFACCKKRWLSPNEVSWWSF